MSPHDLKSVTPIPWFLAPSRKNTEFVRIRKKYCRHSECSIVYHSSEIDNKNTEIKKE